MISQQIKQKIKNHAQSVAPKECCGFVFEKDIFECKNYSENPNHHFSISPREYLKASSLGDFKAVYHSHPQGEAKFSPYDIHVSQNMNLNFILYHNSTDEFLFFDPTDE